MRRLATAAKVGWIGLVIVLAGLGTAVLVRDVVWSQAIQFQPATWAPTTDNFFDLGATNFRWRDVFIGAGTGTQGFSPQGTASINTTSTASTQTAKQTLLSYSLPANTLVVNGKCVRVRFWGTAKATANNKTQTIDFGATTVSSTGAVANNAGNWNVESLVCRTGASAQTAIGTSLSATTPAVTFGTATETETSAIVIAGTSTNVTDTDGTTAKGLLVEFLE